MDESQRLVLGPSAMFAGTPKRATDREALCALGTSRQ